MSDYKPSSWHYTTNEKNERIYDDHILNIIQENLITLSGFIDDVNTDARINILYVQNNVNAKTIKDPTVQVIGMFVSKIIEGLGVVFTAGTAAAIISTIVCKIISGIVTVLTSSTSKDSYNEIQNAANDLRDAFDKTCKWIKLTIAKWLDNLEANWLTEIQCEGNKYPSLRGIVRLCDMAMGGDAKYFPKKETEDYILCRDSLNKASTYEAAAQFIPLRWRIRRHRAFPHDGISNLLCGWTAEWYKVYSRSTWDSWRNSGEFPDAIPRNLAGDIEGPYEYIEKGDSSDTQIFNSWGSHFEYYKWSDGENHGKMGGSRWLGVSGRNAFVTTPELNIVSGLAFFDLIDDILNKKFNGYGDWSSKNSLPDEPSYYLWYKTKRPNESIEIINDKRLWTFMGNSACIDWIYDSNSIFTWGRAYRGITLHHYTLVDQDGNYAPAEFCKWLFIDNGHGKVVNANAVAMMKDVYHDWGLSFE
jgi:hypothetical protein